MDRILSLFAWLQTRKPRMVWSASATFLLGLAVALVAPHQLVVLLYKLVCLTAGAVVLFMVMRELLDCNRPGRLLLPPGADGFREARPGSQVRLWIAITLQGLAAIAGALAMALAL